MTTPAEVHMCNVTVNGKSYYDPSGMQGLADQAGGGITMLVSACCCVVFAILAVISGVANGLKNVFTIILAVCTLLSLVFALVGYFQAKSVSDKYDPNCTPNPTLAPL